MVRQPSLLILELLQYSFKNFTEAVHIANAACTHFLECETSYELDPHTVRQQSCWQW
jgi:hypothetical protein